MHAAAERDPEDRIGDGSDCSAHAESAQARQNSAAVAKAIAESRAQHQETTKTHRVTGGDQRAEGGWCADIVEHARQRGDHYGHAEDVNELHQTQRYDREPTTGPGWCWCALRARPPDFPSDLVTTLHAIAAARITPTASGPTVAEHVTAVSLLERAAKPSDRHKPGQPIHGQPDGREPQARLGRVLPS
jgi:hypothetical protein